mmetsp:Transcript_15485/g.39971  ORF Transcript_15485/g.39971 Transcript_15485/m.39971 type:complete len:207 (-) Transcript_15485:227-847(-)
MGLVRVRPASRRRPCSSVWHRPNRRLPPASCALPLRLSSGFELRICVHALSASDHSRCQPQPRLRAWVRFLLDLDSARCCSNRSRERGDVLAIPRAHAERVAARRVRRRDKLQCSGRLSRTRAFPRRLACCLPGECFAARNTRCRVAHRMPMLCVVLCVTLERGAQRAVSCDTPEILDTRTSRSAAGLDGQAFPPLATAFASRAAL